MAELRVVRTTLPDVPLPTEQEVPQISEELVKRMPELIQYNDDFKVFYRDLRSFTLVLHRLLIENSTQSEFERDSFNKRLEKLENGG